MTLLSPSIILQLIIGIVILTIAILGILLLVRKICPTRKAFLRFLNLKVWICILAAVALLSFILLTYAIKDNANTNISSIVVALDNCFVLCAQNRFYNVQYENWDTQSVKINDPNCIDILANIISEKSYRLVTITPFPSLKESVELYAAYQSHGKKQIIQFTVIKDGLVEICKNSCLWRYKCADKNVLDHVRKAISFPNSKKYRPPLPEKITITREEFNEWIKNDNVQG